MSDMINQIYQLLGKYDIEVLHIEQTSLQTNVSTLRLLSQLQGSIMGYCYLHNIKFDIIEPSKWRKALLFKQGRGVPRKDLKQQAKDYVKNQFNLDVSEDEADAICILCSQNNK